MTQRFLRTAAVALTVGIATAWSLSPLAVAQTAPDKTSKAPASAAKGKQDDANPVVAIVNGKKLRRADVETAQRTLPAQFQQLPMEMIYPLLLDRLIDTQLVTAEGRKKNLQNDPEVKQQLALIEDRLIQQTYLMRRVDERVTDKDLQQRYKKFVENAKPTEEVKARHILVETEEAAKDIVKQLGKGGDFAELAKGKSTGPSAERGGDLGWFTKDDMVPEFAEAAFKMKKGDYSKEPVKTQFGWHVILVEDRRTQPPPSFEEVKEQLRAEAAEEVVAKVVQDLRGTAKIEKFTLEGKPMGEAAPDAGKPGDTKPAEPPKAN